MKDLTNQRYVVELVGPAGSGKTTLRKLMQRETEQKAGGRIVEGVPLSTIYQLPARLKNSVSFWPWYLRMGQQRQWFTKEETRSMAYLDGWHHNVQNAPISKQTIVLFDHGPIFRLAMLDRFGSPMTHQRFFRNWWLQRLQRWSQQLDLVVWLDAPDHILLQRIRTRQQEHVVKNGTADEVFTFLNQYRTSYRLILDEMAKQGLCVKRFNTEHASPEQIAQEVMGVLQSQQSGVSSQGSAVATGAA